MKVGDKVIIRSDISKLNGRLGIVDDFENINKCEGDGLVLVSIKNEIYWFFAKELEVQKI